MVSLLFGCATYKGDGKFSELTRTYVPVIGVTRGFTVELPIFRTTSNVNKSFSLGELPEQTETLYVDLVTAIPKQPPTTDQEIELLNQIPKEHLIKCSLVNSKTKDVITSKCLSVFDFPRMRNKKLKREFILNLLEIKSHTIPIGTPLELQFEYQINERPLDREMLIIVLMDAPLA